MKKKKFDKNKFSKKLEVEEIKEPIFSEGVISTAIAIFFFLLAMLFILAPLSMAGVAGKTIYSSLKTLLGAGFFLLPVLFVMLGISYLKIAKANLALRSALGSILFVFSGLGLLSFLPWDKSGGFLGEMFAYPFIKLFDVYFSGLALFALLIVSFIILFDAAPRMEHFLALKDLLFKKKEEEDAKAISEMSTDEMSRTGLETPSGDKVATEEFTAAPATNEPFPVSETEGEKKEKTGMFGIGKKKDTTKEDEKEKERAKMEAAKANLITRTFIPPPLSLLEGDKGKPGVGDIKGNANTIKRTLQQFQIMVEMDEISVGPSVTRYSLKPAEGVKLNKIVNLQNELSLALAAHPVRIEAPIPGTSLVGVEIPNHTKTTVGMLSLLSGADFIGATKPLFLSLGKSIVGKLHYGNLGGMPHLLVAGTTGSGKSVMVHAMIVSLLYRNPPENLRLILVDAKRVELPAYNGIPHLATPHVITHARKAIQALGWAVKEMDRRYDVLEGLKLQSIGDYHKKVLNPYLKKIEDASDDKKEKLKVTGIPQEDIEKEAEMAEEKKSTEKVPERMPYYVIVIDELSDLMSTYPRELESSIVRLAQLGRAAGIHLIIATQRPSVDVITGLIKANIPTRIAMRVISNIDSRTILDMGGAEKLLGAGDMLYMTGELPNPIRLQSPFISMDEIKKVVNYLTDKHQDEVYDTINIDEIVVRSDPNNSTGMESNEDDELVEKARAEIISSQKASTSYLQRKLGVGYSRAAKLIDILEEMGVVGPSNGSKGREVLIKPGMDDFGISEEDMVEEDEVPSDEDIEVPLEEKITSRGDGMKL
ncbi:MAG: DNA translocase FtsK [Candidatus Pacebacteria bacterium]|nr:DNA translocase FtsK [Candidatus Paceibacterota bacterium]